MGQLIFLETAIKMPFMHLPVRSTLVPLQSGSALISPGSKLKLDELKKINSVTDIVAPNLFHCSGVMKASSVFPNAKKWAAPGAKDHKPQISWTDELSESHWPHQNELPMIFLAGMPKVNEVVFIHKDTKSLIVADLCFNLLDVNGFGSWIILNLFGSYKKFAVSKFLIKFTTDKNALEKSLGKLFSYDFENIILGHGSNVLGGGKDKLLSALRERNLQPR